MWDSYRVAETGVCIFWATLDPNRHKQSQTNQHAEEMKQNKTSNCLNQVISTILQKDTESLKNCSDFPILREFVFYSTSLVGVDFTLCHFTVFFLDSISTSQFLSRPHSLVRPVSSNI